MHQLYYITLLSGFLPGMLSWGSKIYCYTDFSIVLEKTLGAKVLREGDKLLQECFNLSFFIHVGFLNQTKSMTLGKCSNVLNA